MELHDEMLKGLPQRLHFTYLRSCEVSCGERPCSWPFCHYVAWQLLGGGRARVYYVRLDLPGDGHKPRLRHRRLRPDEMIVCAKRLSAFPPRRYWYRPTREQRKAVKTKLAVHHEIWSRWAAEYEPVPTLPQRWFQWWGPRKRARQIVLASETELRWIGYFSAHAYSYLRLEWFYPTVPNRINSHALKDRACQIVGYFAIDPHRQLDLSCWCQRVLVLDHRQGTINHVFGAHPLDDYKDCVVTSTLYPGCEPEPMTESRLIVAEHGELKQHKKRFLASIGRLPREENQHE